MRSGNVLELGNDDDPIAGRDQDIRRVGDEAVNGPVRLLRGIHEEAASGS